MSPCPVSCNSSSFLAYPASRHLHTLFLASFLRLASVLHSILFSGFAASIPLGHCFVCFLSPFLSLPPQSLVFASLILINTRSQPFNLKQTTDDKPHKPNKPNRHIAHIKDTNTHKHSLVLPPPRAQTPGLLWVALSSPPIPTGPSCPQLPVDRQSRRPNLPTHRSSAADTTHARLSFAGPCLSWPLGETPLRHATGAAPTRQPLSCNSTALSICPPSLFSVS